MSPISDPKPGSKPDSHAGRRPTPSPGEPTGGDPAARARVRTHTRATFPPEEDEALREPGRREEPAGFFPELLRRGLTLGFTGVFMTEEAVRRALGDSVPRDLIEFVVAQSDRTRAELLERLSREFGRVLASFDPAEVARRLLEGRSVEMKATFRLVPDPAADDEELPAAEADPPPGAEKGRGTRARREPR